MTQSLPTWKRFFSWEFLVNKLREKGLLWFLKKAIFKVGFGVFWRIRNYLLTLIAGGLRLLSIKTNWGTGYFYLGKTLDKLGDSSGAIESYQKVVELKPYWAEAYIELANLIYTYPSDLDLLYQTITYLKQAIRLQPDSIKANLKLSLILMYNGEFSESINATQRAVKLYQEQQEINPLSQLGIRFLTPEYYTGWRWLGGLGHLAGNIRYYIQVGMLGHRRAYHTILLAPEDQVANHCLLNYWNRYLTIITNPFLVRCLEPISKPLRPLEYSLYNVALDKHQMQYITDACSVTQQEWEAQGREPLLTLSTSDYERGWQCLHEMGIPQNAWFVSMHVREGGFTGDERNLVHTYRNSDINSYRKAIKLITQYGGWVIRIGDPKMSPLQPGLQMIDYARSNWKSDWMDIFLLSQCRFFIGTSSGPCDIPPLFGVPSVLVNVWPIWEGTFTSKDIFIPKLFWSQTEKRYLTFDEASQNHLWKNYNSTLIASWGISVVDNTSEEIEEVVLEMFNQLEGNHNYTVEHEQLQHRFNSLAQPHLGYIPNNRVGTNFLRKWSNLLVTAPHQEV